MLTKYVQCCTEKEHMFDKKLFKNICYVDLKKFVSHKKLGWCA